MTMDAASRNSVKNMTKKPVTTARIARIAGQIGRTTSARLFTSIISAMP